MNDTQQTKISLWRINLIVLIILGLYPLVGMGIDLIAPSLPAISQQLHTSSGIVKNLISIYLFAYALATFCMGFLSDILGRRKLLLGGLLLFVLCSLLPIIFNNITALLLARFLQGFAIATFVVVSRAILSDILTTEKLLRTAPAMATLWGLGPILGPIFGGYLQYYFNWQACFYAFSLYALIGLLMMAWVLPETIAFRQQFIWKNIKNNFITITTHRLFMGVIILMGITYSLLIVFNTLGPFLIQTSLGYSSIYFGKLALLMGLSYLIGTLTCRQLIKHISPEKIFYFAVPATLAITILSLPISYFYATNIWIISIHTLLMFFACGIIYPAGLGKALSIFRQSAGSGAAVMNLVCILITSIVAFLMGFMSASTAIPLTSIYLGLMIFGYLVYWQLIKRNSTKFQTTNVPRRI